MTVPRTFARDARRALLQAGLAVLLAGTAFPQSGATLQGSVADAQGVPVPGAAVTATETRTNETRSVVSDASGRYVFSDLKDGLYRVDAELKGFKTFSRDGVEL